MVQQETGRSRTPGKVERQAQGFRLVGSSPESRFEREGQAVVQTEAAKREEDASDGLISLSVLHTSGPAFSLTIKDSCGRILSGWKVGRI
jgi:hypothetical protein